MWHFGPWDVPVPDFMDNQWGYFAIWLLVWVIFGLLVVVVVRPIVHRIFKGTKTDLDDKILEIIDVPVVVFIFFYGFVWALGELKDIPDWLHRDIMQVYGLVVAVFVVYIVFKVFKAIFLPLGREYAKKTETTLDDLLLPVLEKIGIVIIFGFGTIYILRSIGLDVTVFLGGAAIIGLVLAFALQETLSDFFAGVFLLLDRPIKVGDLVLDGDDYLRVQKIGLRSVWFYNIFKHDLIIYPNHIVANMKLTNLSEPDKRFKINVSVGVAYGSPIEKVEKIMLEAISAQPGVLTEDADRLPFVRFGEFGDSALQFTVYGWVDDIMDQWRVKHDVRKHIDRRFREEGIEIPFPQRVVTVKHEDGVEPPLTGRVLTPTSPGPR
jgi:MscS family membrane protein